MPGADSMDFTYSRLGPGQLRLLRPVAVVDGISISLEISHFERDRAPPYAAVSYTWGEGDEIETLQLNRRQIRVRRNLWSCLHYLGLYARDGMVKYLWVDAICIDQSNVAERNAQVRVMDEIYKNARYVSIWLGLDPRFEHYRDRIEGPITTFYASDFNWHEHAKKLADHEYWSRYWVIQECLLARDVQVHCGENVAAWEDFRVAISVEAKVNLLTYPGDSRTAETLDSRKHGALALLLARPAVEDFPWQRPLDELIIHHRHSRCKDPRDRVFSLLGLLPLEERKLLERFFPNYSLSEDRVVVITLAHLQKMNGVRVTTKCRELFQGLGVESKERRTRLISAAAKFSYFDYDITSSPAFHKALSVYEATVDESELERLARFGDGGLETIDNERSTISRCNIL
ncbi:hypothetical protein EKO27_g4502 [Xylaria grammica]|uniref:Heterokaryon incompatibility domain-containing protein n=1 Tax=Xylaria grammica TaxID=363999 RepID=A0A439D873_9PEZI|nr:hypothetical protein EKO27_g4502 [Xylaria grammica]